MIRQMVCCLMVSMMSSAMAGTIAQFNFDSIEADGKTVPDLSGNGHHAVHVHQVYLRALDPFNLGLNRSVEQLGINGTAWYFAQLQNPDGINLAANGHNFTMEAWVKPTKYQSGIFSYENTWGGNGDHLYTFIDLDENGKFRMYQYDVWGGWGMNITSPDSIPLNTWTHLAVVCNDRWVSLYVNGVKVGQEGFLSWNPNFGLSVFRIGNAWAGEFNGLIDDVRISDVALAPSALGYHQSFTTNVAPTPVAKFNFDTISLDRTRVPDLSGNNHDAVFRAPVIPPVGDDPFNVDASQSVYVNDTVSGLIAFLDNPETINLNNGGNSFTLECWFKPEEIYGSTLIGLNGQDRFYAYLGMRDDAVSVAKFFAADFGGWFEIAGPALSTGTWYHLAATYDRGILALYVDGTKVNETGCIGASLPVSLTWAIIGGGGSLGASDGWIDDVMISSYAKESADFANTASFTPGTVYADEFGYNAVDATDALQKAINSGASKVIVRNMGSPWYVNKTLEVNYRSHFTLQLENGVQIQDKDGAFWDNEYTEKLIRFMGGDHLLLDGYGAELKMRKSQYLASPYLPSEFRVGLFLCGVEDMTVQGVTIRDAGSDGISVDYGYKHYSENVLIKDVLVDNSYRNGVSICSGNNITLDNVSIKNTSGTAPQFGLDIEPYFDFHRVTNILVKNCTFIDNAAGSVTIVPMIFDITAPVSVTIKDSVMTGGGSGIQWHEFGQSGSGNTGSVLIENVSISNIAQNAINIVNKTSDPGIDLHFKNVQVTASSNSGYQWSPIVFSGVELVSQNSPLGNVWFENVTVTDSYNRPFLSADIPAQTLGIKNVTGLFTVNSPYTPFWTLGSNLTNVNIQLTTTQIPGDANGDGKVDVGDLGILAANYGRNLQSEGVASNLWWSLGDFNQDGKVDVGDLGILAANYGLSGSSFEADYAKVFGTAVEIEGDETDSLCSSLGLPLIVGLALMGLMLVKLEE